MRSEPIQRAYFPTALRISLWAGLVALAAGAICSAGQGTAERTDQPDAGEATHVQVEVIRPREKGSPQQLACFCLTKEGHLVTVIRSRPDVDAHAAWGTAAEPSSDTGNTSPAEVRLLDRTGKLLAQWPLDFAAQSVNVGVDGRIVLGGGWHPGTRTAR